MSSLRCFRGLKRSSPWHPRSHCPATCVRAGRWRRLTAQKTTRHCPSHSRSLLYDNHAHLEIADGDNPLDFREHLDRAQSVGVAGVVQVGTDVPTSLWSADVAAIEPRVLAAVALHPNEAPELHQKGTLDDALQVIDDLAKRPRVVAIGETGLDFFPHRGSPPGATAPKLH